jgi:hypothetical protein
VNSSGNLGTFEVSSGSSGSSGTSGSSGSSGTSGGGTSSYIITIKEVGSNIVMAGSGTLNINGLTLLAGATGPMNGAGLGVNSATFILGANGGYFDQYGGILTNPTNFGSGSGLGSDTSSGDIVGAVYNGAPPHLLIVPVGYTSGSYLSSSQTFNNKSFSSLGLTPGTYSYTWGTGSNAETMRVVVGGTASGGGTESGGTGSGATGSWFFYQSAEGTVTAGAPVNLGNAIFVINGGTYGTYNTFNPNKISGASNNLYFNVRGYNGTDYTTQFTNLRTYGGTISIAQGANAATYTLGPNVINFDNGTYSQPGTYSFIGLPTQGATMVASASTPFTYGTSIDLNIVPAGGGGGGNPFTYVLTGSEGGPATPANSNGRILMSKSVGGFGVNTLNPDLRIEGGLQAPNLILFYALDNNGSSAVSLMTSMDANGGTLTLSQGGNTAIFTLPASSVTYNSGASAGYFSLNAATQIQTAGSTFTTGSVTVTFTPN